VVVFPSRTVDTGYTDAYAALLEHGLIQRVYLDELTTGEGRGWQMALLRLTVAPQDQAPDMARRLIEQTQGAGSHLDRLQMLDLVEMVLVYKLPRLTREEIRQMLHLLPMTSYPKPML